MIGWVRLAIVVLLGGLSGPLAAEFELSGSALLEGRAFPSGGAHGGQHGANASVAIKPEFYWNWDDGDRGIETRQP